MLIPENINFQFKASWNLRTCHHTMSRDDELGIQCESSTRKTDHGYGVGKSKSYYFIDNIEKEFLSLEELCDFYNEKFQYEEDNPDQEVVYVKVIKKRDNSIKE